MRENEQDPNNIDVWLKQSLFLKWFLFYYIFLHAWADALWSVVFILMRCHSSHKGHGSKSFTRWHCLFTHWVMTDVIFALSEWKIELWEVRRAASRQQWNSFESLKNALTLYKCINVEDTIVDTPVHHLIVDHSSIIAAQILFNSGTQRPTTVTTTASFTIIYCSAFCVCFNEHMIFSLSAMRPTQVYTLLTCSEGQWAAVLLQIKTVSHDCAHAAGADFFHEQPSEISEDRQLALTRCWLRVHFLSMTCLPKILFVIVSISDEQHKEKSTCPRNCEDSQSALNRLSARCYLWTVSTFRAWQSCTISCDLALYNKILTGCVLWNFPLHFIPWRVFWLIMPVPPWMFCIYLLQGSCI